MEFLLPILLQANASVYTSAAAVYTENTLAVLLTLITIVAVSVQIARGYFLRVLRKFTLRLAADMWWLMFVILRDASIFLVVFLGFMLFYPGTYQDFPIAVPFQPLAIDLYAIALVILLVKDTDEEMQYNTYITLLVGAGTLLYIFGTIFVTESALQLAVLPPTVSNKGLNIWGIMYNVFNSAKNPALAIYSFYVCGLVLLVAGGVAFYYGLKGQLPRNVIDILPKPRVKDTNAPQKQDTRQPKP